MSLGLAASELQFLDQRDPSMSHLVTKFVEGVAAIYHCSIIGRYNPMTARTCRKRPIELDRETLQLVDVMLEENVCISYILDIKEGESNPISRLLRQQGQPIGDQFTLAHVPRVHPSSKVGLDGEPEMLLEDLRAGLTIEQCLKKVEEDSPQWFGLVFCKASERAAGAR